MNRRLTSVAQPLVAPSASSRPREQDGLPEPILVGERLFDLSL
jgi:hypothetical protein